MSVTISSIITNINSYIGDTSNDRVTEAERLQAVTESTAWLLEELGNEHMIETYELDYLDTINYYKVTGSIPDLLTGADLRREIDNYQSFTRKSPREMSEEIAQHNTEPSWAIERKNDDIFLAINAEPRSKGVLVSDLSSTTNWSVDATGSDATNLRADSSEKRWGAASLAFDVDVSQSGNNKATIYTNLDGTVYLADQENNSRLILEVYIPDVTEVTSVSITIGSDVDVLPSTKANYWTGTVTTDIDGAALADGWNTVSLSWNAMSTVGTPDADAVAYVELTVNYGAGQIDDTHFRMNHFRIAKPEKLIFHYISWNVGYVSSVDATAVTAFTATTNVPFFSGKYDQYKYPVAQKAASIIFGTLRLREESADYEDKAVASLVRYRKNFESSKSREVKSFKIMGNNLRRRNKTGKIR